MDPVSQAVADQFERAWEMAREIFGAFTPEQWKAGERPEMVPARWALHLVETADFYARDAREGFRFGHRFEVDWEADPDRLPDRDVVLAYLEEARERTAGWLASLDDRIMEPETAFPWTGKTRLDHALYLLRHTQQHLGELGMLTRLYGASEVCWR